MASSGVWENVMLAKTPRCIGVCVSIKFFILFLFLFYLILIMDDVIAIDVGRCFLPILL